MGFLHKLTPAELNEAQARHQRQLPDPRDAKLSFWEELSKSETSARSGDASAIQHIRLMRDLCDAVLCSIPKALRRKKASPETAANKLAVKLIMAVYEIWSGKSQSSDLALNAKIRKLRSFSDDVFPAWWKEAMGVARSTADKEILDLICEVGETGERRFWGERFEEKKKIVLKAAGLAAKSGLHPLSYPTLSHLVRKAERARFSYALGQARKAARSMRRRLRKATE
jgi:hypothetical protein